jgi:hypothetical protein
MASVVIIGPAYPLRGGLATFNQRLAQEFISQGHSCEIISFSLQYPSLLFPGKTQLSNDPAPAGIRILSMINSINPINWMQTGRFLKKRKTRLDRCTFLDPFYGSCIGNHTSPGKKELSHKNYLHRR